MKKRKQSNVTPLFGAHLPTGQPPLDVVLFCKELYAKALRGEIIGIGVAFVDGGNSTVATLAEGHARSELLIAAVRSLDFEMMTRYRQAAEVTEDVRG